MSAKKLLMFAVRLWIFGGLATFFLSILIGAAGAPRQLELPWSQFNDFIVGSDESVYVHARTYARVLRYDSSGRFVASYRAPEWGYGEFATDISGHIYLRVVNRVYVYDRDWNQLDAKAGDFYSNRMWILNEISQLQVASPDRTLEPVPDRAVSPGELLFSSPQTDPRDHFTLMDGSYLERSGDQLTKYSRDGQVVGSYGTRWYLWWAKFPVPLASSFLLVFIWGVLEKGRLGRYLKS